ncbi:MAG: BatA domain-containing protein, partial [Granulosicoccus sp.]
AYLLGLVGLALPWLLHRFSDQNPPEELFPSKRFLDATTPPVSRKQTLRYRALLALRILSLLLLCFLFAQPWLQRGDLTGSPQQHHIIAIDQSLSMRADGLWQNAMQQAEDLLNDLRVDSTIELVGFDQQLLVLASNTQQPADFTAALDDLQPGYGSTNYGVLMQGINKLAAEQDLSVKLWLISDLQQSALPAQLNALYAPNVEEIELLAVRSEGATNVHLSANASSDDGVNAKITASLQASVAGASVGAPIERTVVVEFEGSRLASAQRSLQPGELEIVAFDDIVLPAQSNPVLTVRLLEDDVLQEDNEQALIAGQSQSTAIVLLRSPGSSYDDAAVFVATALETDDLATVESLRGTADQVPSDVSHVVTARDLTAPLDLDVLQFVDAGGNALVFNTQQPQVSEQTLLAGASVAEVDESHPLALGDIDWFGVQFYQLPAVRLNDDDRVLLRTDDQQVILFERPTNRGRLLVLNDPLDGQASDLPLQPAFVSLVRSMINYFDASTSIPERVLVGDRVSLPPNVQVLDPQDNSMVALSDSSSGSSVQITEPGLYTVVGRRGEQRLMAWIDAREADLRSISSESVDAWVARYEQDDAVGQTADTLEVAASERRQLMSHSDQLRDSLWKWIFPLFMMALMIESVYANRRLNVRRDGS